MQDNGDPRNQARRRSTLGRAVELFAEICELELARVDGGDDYRDEPATPFSRRPWTLTLDPTGFSATIELAGDAWLALDATDLTRLLEVSLAAGATVQAGGGVRVLLRGVA